MKKTYTPFYKRICFPFFSLRLLFVLWASGSFFTTAFAQGTQTDFGQNRVQYKTFDWSFFESEHFVTYFYLGGQDLGRFAAEYGESVVGELEEKLEYNLSRRIEIMVYNDLSDLNQTNIGSGLELYNTGGIVQILDNKMFIYFNGDHEHLRRQIRQGISGVIVSRMLFGGNFQEVLQNAVLLSLPDWFTAGLVSYMGEPWSSEMDNRLRDGILSGRFKNFNKLEGGERYFAGHALWHYIEEKYGSSAVSNLLYLTRINRSMESGFLFVLGGSIKAVQQQWYDYYYEKYTTENTEYAAIGDEGKVKLKTRRKFHHFQLKTSPDAKYLTFATNHMGRFKVHLLNTESGKKKVLRRGGIRTTALKTDYSYPLMAWAPDGSALVVVFEKRDKLKMLTYDMEKKKKSVKPITKFQQINDISFMQDKRFLVLSAVNKGQSDIFTYYLPSTLVEQLTDDFYDDLQPAAVDIDGRKGIVFSSNRLDDTLRTARFDSIMPNEKYDLFFYDTERKGEVLGRLTNSPMSNEWHAKQYDDGHFGFLSDRNGIYNQYAGELEEVIARYDTVVFFRDSMVTNPRWDLREKLAEPESGVDSFRILPVNKLIGVSWPMTNLNTGIVEQDMAGLADKTANLILEDGGYTIYLKPQGDAANPTVPQRLPNTGYRNYYLNRTRQESVARKKEEEKARAEEEKKQRQKQALEQDTVVQPEITYFFQSDFNTAPEVHVFEYEEVVPRQEQMESIYKYTRVAPYQLKFSTDHLQVQFFDNTLLMTRYQKFAPGYPVFTSPEMSGLIRVGVSDLFEDIRIIGGFRFPYNFKGSEYFVTYQNQRKRLDKELTYYRKVDSQEFTNQDVLPYYNNTPPFRPAIPINAKAITDYVEFRLIYPIDVIRSIRWGLAYRHESFVYQASEDFTLNIPNYNENWFFTRLEFVFDHTIKTGLNLYNGTRFKVYGELHKPFTLELDTVFNNIKLDLPHFDNAYLGVLGFDFRHYQKIHKEIIWANRFAAGTSYGNRKLIYYLGGVDSWIGPRFDRGTRIAEDNNYAFQTIATNMRGFQQNVRNGNSFAVVNSELRVPIIEYLVTAPIKSEFLRSLQVVGFTDVGTAWEGLSPYDDDNPLYTDNIETPSVKVKVEYFRNPIVVGYGFGLRASLFGYFIRMDVAWGNDSGTVTKPPLLYFSLSLDF